MSLAITERTSCWVVREWNGRPDIASIFQEIYDTRVTGKVMLHIQNGHILAVELCERHEYSRAEIPVLDFLEISA